MRRGIRVGMPLSEAQTFVRGNDRLFLEEVAPADDRQALIELALRCERFSFRIGLEETDRPESILLEVTGLAHFFAGEENLAAELERVLSAKRYAPRIAISDTLGAAWGTAHFLARPRQPVVVPPGDWDRLTSLPVQALRLDPLTTTKLARLGITTIQQLFALDRPALRRRLGGEVLRRLDQFRGEQREEIVPCHPLPRYEVARTLEEGILHPEGIAKLWSQLLRQLLDKLTPHRLGLRQLECRCGLENRTTQLVSLRLYKATNDAGHIAELWRYQQEKLQLSAPLILLELEAQEILPLEASQQQLFDASESQGETEQNRRQFQMLLNRLSSRLGEEGVLVPMLLPDPIPERAVRLQSVFDSGTSSTAPSFLDRFHGLDRPTALFPEPRPIDVLAIFPDGPPSALFWQGARIDLAWHSEPERIESGWWQGEYIRRDYYQVRTVPGQWLWIFRRLQDNHWFWHGELM
ncbi:MAG: nucleotidyltransferase [Planctomyces sp.]|nr:nucleotidyltransferase [Planctomyces sp.]